MLELQSQPRDAPPRRRVWVRGPWGVLIAAVLMATVLFGSALLIQRRVQHASDWAARGEAEAFVVSIRDALRVAPERSAETLEIMLEAFEPDGLRHLSLVRSDGVVIATAGSPRGRSLEPEVLEALSEGRVRWVSELGTRDGRRRPRSWRRSPRPRPPPPRLQETLLVVELEPLAAAALQREARTLLGVAGVAGLGILALAVAFARLLSRQERLREELTAGQRLAALGTMSAVLAHELRNPLAALKGHAQLLAEDVEDDPLRAPQARQMVEGAERLERLLDNLLRFVKTGTIERSPVDPNLPLLAAARPFGELIEVEPGPRAPVPLDAARLEQALANLLQNAAEVTPQGARVEASLRREGAQLVYRIRDHGPGLPAGAEASLFEPFTTHKARGVGLGLSISRRVAELHGGTLTAQTLPDGGACFTLTLPLSHLPTEV
ncbi:MAG TPA: HAMP domain-containing sensor histidine kinase [Myxococcaceae bacterium]|nr:HAMP domain-containing sensor histidine kinase [Myxococcaceae bacterium]